MSPGINLSGVDLNTMHMIYSPPNRKSPGSNLSGVD